MIAVKQQLVTSREKTYGGVNPGTSISLHDTGNKDVGADAQAHADLQSSGNVRQASWHYQVDDKQAIQSFPHDVQCWHAGDGEGPGNTTSIAIEMCVNADGDFNKTIINTVALVVKLMRELKLTVQDIKDHHYWSGKNCPASLRSAGKWQEFLRAIDGGPIPNNGGNTMAKWSSPLPKGCRFTSGFGTRWGTLHAGADWGPPKPGQTGVPVYAVHDGPVLATGYGYGRAGDRIPYHSGRFIWQDIGVHGGDRMRLYYGHLARVLVKTGQRVKAGQIIGYMGGSGARGENHFAIHLHLGVSVNHNKPTGRWNARTNSGWTDPVRWLRSKGITVGSTRPATSSTSASKPKASKAKTSKPKTAVDSGREWPEHKLVVDGKFWLVTKRGYQRLLAPSSVGGYKGYIDGVIGTLTVKAEQRWLASRGFYKGRIDGQRGPMTIKALQRKLKADGFYSGRVDGKFQQLSIKGLQRLMNSQQNLYK